MTAQERLLQNALRPLSGLDWRPIKGLAASLCIAVIAGCAAGDKPQLSKNLSEPAQGTQPVANAGAAQYRLGSGDKVRLAVYGEEDMSGVFTVNGNGNISLPLVGQIAAQGHTLDEFEKKFTGKLKTYIKHPQVSVEVINYRPFYIHGEVKKSGEYPYVNALTVENAVAKAQGFTYRAITSYVHIKRAGETAAKKYSLSAPVRVLPGDNILISERFF